MSEEKNVIASNIRVLRSERRMSVEEFAEASGYSVETIKAWEAGITTPLTKELVRICPILRISVEDIEERDIAEERAIASKKMKQGKSRGDYDWYLGDRKRIAFYVISLVLIAAAYLITFLYFRSTIGAHYEEYLEYYGQVFFIKYWYICYPVFISSLISDIFIIIEAYKKFNLRFQWWYLFIISSIYVVLIIIGIILFIPYIVYAIIKIVKELLKSKR